MTKEDPRAKLWVAYRAWMLERTGLTSHQIETFMEYDRQFWAQHPAAAQMIRGRNA